MEYARKEGLDRLTQHAGDTTGKQQEEERRDTTEILISEIMKQEGMGKGRNTHRADTEAQKLIGDMNKIDKEIDLEKDTEDETREPLFLEATTQLSGHS